MSYRTLKRWIGETNFELKCLLLFGSGLSLLAVGTFFLYRWQTSSLIDRDTRATARSLVSTVLLETHWKWAIKNFKLEASLGGEPLTRPQEPQQPVFSVWLAGEAANDKLQEMIDELGANLQFEDLQGINRSLLHPDSSAPGADARFRPTDDRGHEALRKLKAGAKNDEVVELVGGDENEYQYYRALRATESCIRCHKRLDAEGNETTREIGELLEIGESTSRSQYTRSKALLETMLIRKKIIDQPREDLSWLATVNK